MNPILVTPPHALTDLDIYLNKMATLRVETPIFVETHDVLRRVLREVGTTVTPAFKHFVGHSKAGKSYIFRQFEMNYPAARTSDGIRKEVIYVQVPSQGTIAGVIEALLEALGDPKYDEGTISKKTARLKKLLVKVGCKMVILDEFQELVDKNQNRSLSLTTNWLKELAEMGTLSVVCVGLPSSSRIVRHWEQLRTRFSRTIEIPVHDWTDAQSRKVFRSVLRGVYTSMAPFSVPDLTGQELSLRMFIACGGRLGLLWRILDQAVKDAIWENRTEISLAHFDAAFQEAIWFAGEIPMEGGPFFGSLSADEQQRLCGIAMYLAQKPPKDYEDEELHLGSMQRPKEEAPSKPLTKKQLKAELNRALT
ncbi:MAG: hypothetical protein DI562_10125 [Stenotrophomonas acidaminiphila]|nr:MAG: hypothetical protein DI562_10125 [Stenotrophomonas acidaminiphila]